MNWKAKRGCVIYAAPLKIIKIYAHGFGHDCKCSLDIFIIFIILIKLQKVKAYFLIKFPIYLAVNDKYKHFAGGADYSPV